MNRSTVGQPIRSRWKFLQVLRLLIVFGLLAVLLWKVPLADALKVLAATDLALLAFSLSFLIPILLLMAAQLRILCRAQQLNLGLGRLLFINVNLRFYDLFLPGGGSAVRWYKMSQLTGKKVKTVAVLAFSRLLTMFLTFSMTLGFWILSQSQGLQTGVVVYAFFLVSIVLAWLALLRFGEPLAAWLGADGGAKRASPLLRWTLTRAGRLIDSLRAFRNMTWSDMLLLLIVGISWQLLGAVAFTVMARSVSIEATLLDLGWVRGVVAMATTLPISIAGGLGIREVSTVALLLTLGVTPEQALAFSFLTLAQNVLLALIGGLLEAGESLQAARFSRQL